MAARLIKVKRVRGNTYSLLSAHYPSAKDEDEKVLWARIQRRSLISSALFFDDRPRVTFHGACAWNIMFSS